MALIYTYSSNVIRKREAISKLVSDKAKESDKIAKARAKIDSAILASNPTDTQSLRLDTECRAIQELIRKSDYRDKLDFYLEALDRQVKKENGNPSVGLLLCATKNDEVVEYAMSRTMSPMLVSEYKLQLPDKKVLQKKLQELVNIPMIEED